MRPAPVHPRGTQVTSQAMLEVGRAKHQLVCRYLHDRDLQREINSGLNAAESWNRPSAQSRRGLDNAAEAFAASGDQDEPFGVRQINHPPRGSRPLAAAVGERAGSHAACPEPATVDPAGAGKDRAVVPG